jgi:hypothetical protein
VKEKLTSWDDPQGAIPTHERGVWLKTEDAENGVRFVEI